MTRPVGTVASFAVAVVMFAGVISSAPVDASGAFRFERKDDKFLELYEGDKPVLTYVYGENLKEGAPKNQERSSYVHPVYGMDGEIVTDDFPKDHYHHRGIFWSWAQVTVDGKTHDPWTIGSRSMLKHFEKWIAVGATDETARIGVNNGWYVGDKKVVDEKVELLVHHPDDVSRSIDIALTLEAVDEPVDMSGRPTERKGYGGFGFRYAPRKGQPAITNIDGLRSKDVIRDPSPWADFSARFHDRATTSGVAVFVHPSHPAYPPGWLLRHYGYIGLTWPGLDQHVLKKGEPITLRYRVYIHRGNANEGRVAEAYAKYAKQP